MLALFLPPRSALAGQGKPGRAYQTYVVQQGDTLARVARRFHVSARTIRRVNHLKSARLKPGQRLKIPITKPLAHACGDSYQARAGETVRGVARRCGVSEKALRAINHLGRKRRIPAGRLLRIPSENRGRGRTFLPVPGH
jgi:LysM repeat protein